MGKVWISDGNVGAIARRPSYGLVVSGLRKVAEENSLISAMENRIMQARNSENEKPTQETEEIPRWLSGSDGRRMLAGKIPVSVVNLRIANREALTHQQMT